MNLEILVTGTGRCGTGYSACLLTSMGFPCGHESIFNIKGIQGARKILKGNEEPTISKIMAQTHNVELKKIVADSSYMAAPYLDDKILERTKIIHIIRHPLFVIGSFVLEGGYFGDKWPGHSVAFQKFIKKHLPIVYNNNFNPFDRAALFYIEWSNIIKNKLKNKKYLFHKIEDDSIAIANFLGANKFDKKLNKNINSWNHSNRLRIGMKEFNVFDEEIVKFCEEYNYEI